MKQKVRYAIVGVAFVAFLTLLHTGLNAPQAARMDSGSRMVMGTFSRIVVMAPSERTARECLDAAFEVQRRIDSLMSYHADDSELNRVNRLAAEKPVAVNPLTFRVLEEAIRFSELSDGAFDVTVGPLVDLWKQAGRTNTPPSAEALAEVRARVGSDKLILDEGNLTVRFAVEGMRIDLGGIAKGFAIDKSVEAMRRHGALGGLVDIGGDVRCFGITPQGQDHWRIGLQDPSVDENDPAGEPLLVLRVNDAAVTTSGDYRRFTRVKGEKQSHILDTRTGRGAARLASVTIMAPDAMTADALATAVSVLGPEEGLALIERTPGVEAILIPAGDLRPVFSSNARAYTR